MKYIFDYCVLFLFVLLLWIASILAGDDIDYDGN